MRASKPQRTSERKAVAVPARLTWRDTSGAVRFASVMTRDISAAGVFVEADQATNIPLFRLVHVQLEREGKDRAEIPEVLRQGRLLAAVWRVGSCRRSTGTPEGYALRFLLDQPEQSARPAGQTMAVAS